MVPSEISLRFQKTGQGSSASSLCGGWRPPSTLGLSDTFVPRGLRCADRRLRPSKFDRDSRCSTLQPLLYAGRDSSYILRIKEYAQKPSTSLSTAYHVTTLRVLFFLGLHRSVRARCQGARSLPPSPPLSCALEPPTTQSITCAPRLPKGARCTPLHTFGMRVYTYS